MKCLPLVWNIYSKWLTHRFQHFSDSAKGFWALLVTSTNPYRWLHQQIQTDAQNWALSGIIKLINLFLSYLLFLVQMLWITLWTLGNTFTDHGDCCLHSIPVYYGLIIFLLDKQHLFATYITISPGKAPLRCDTSDGRVGQKDKFVGCWHLMVVNGNNQLKFPQTLTLWGGTANVFTWPAVTQKQIKKFLL